MRMRGLEGWALTPFGPERALLQDLGWWKGKWSEGEGMNSRWGGWFEDVQTDVGEKVDEEAVAPYLPHLVFPSLPTEIDLPRHLLPDPHALPPTKKGGDTAMEEDDDGEAPPEEEEEQAQAEEREKLKVWLGSLKNGEEGQEKIELGRFESRRLDEFLPRKPGFIFNAGGAVMGLDWCPLPHPPSPVEYLALTTISSHSASISRTINPGPSLIQIWSLDMTTPSDFAIETDKEEGGEGMKMVMGLCIEEGDAWEVKWCPRGGSGEEDAMQVDGEENGRLGILAGAFADGSVSLFAVPDPKKAGAEEGKVLYLKAKPILKLTLPDTTCDSIAWASHETIAAGCNNGYIAIWDVGSALRSGATITRPLQYFPTHTASIRSLTFLRTPPLHRSLDGTLNTDQEPTYIASAGHDGSTTLIDLADTTAPVVITHDRGFIGAIAWSPHTGCIVTHDADAAVRLISIKAKDFAATRAVVKLTGVVQNLATSDHHPFVASASADGACTLSNAARTSKKKAYKGHYFHRVFRLDFNRLLGEYRMIDNLHVESTVGIDSTLRPPSKATAKNDYAAITGAWAPEINVSRVCWHPSLNRACLLASGTVSGLVRVDWVEGGAPGS
ncbi:WD40-repeat-containing domain protein [Leucosporidium creatinivorum]|uniref:WD40-repeat-containing domain protein n=1 Tax=Leucosporidium creatinivorum TaxID=106004 RepID=A0A1Y2FCU7_9BASI|nr:WD40-repeat-containing domain protein [Leucosporidium creatinivorum]